MPNFVPKIIFFDIDDTLYHKQHGLHPNTQSALARLIERGITVAIATGRSPAVFPEAVNALIKQLPIETIIGINGQYTRHQSALLQNNAIPHPDIHALKALCADHGWEYCLISDTHMAVSCDTPRIQTSLTPIGPYHVQPDYEQHSPIYQMLLFIDAAEQATIADNPLFQKYKMLRWHPVSVDVLHQHVSKALGIQLVCDKLGVSPKDCMAFGDGWNDVEMFEAVGFAVAMGNAVDEVKARAQFITHTTHDNGIAHALAHLGLL